ncbi:MAG TPA: Hint domain-containing protein, partial [Kofleriaceae bacterium]|nr:Hint domain-containing protein [Kofleriaceae bacterium]
PPPAPDQPPPAPDQPPPAPDQPPPAPDQPPPAPDRPPPAPDQPPPAPDRPPPAPDQPPPAPDRPPPAPDQPPPAPDRPPPAPDRPPPAPDRPPPAPDRPPPAPDRPPETPVDPDRPTSPPPRTAEGGYDFSQVSDRALSRHANHDPFPGESPADAEARAHAAQEQVRQRMDGLKPCFVAGTLVLTPDGPFPIEQIAVGTRVLAMDPDHPETLAAYRVLELFRGHADAVVDVAFDDERITATLNHRFHVIGRGWVRAEELATDDAVTGRTGPRIVRAVTRREVVEEPTFNLHVDEVSTYFVGRAGALVHNDDPNFDRELFWMFGDAKKGPRVDPRDTDGISMWRTRNKAEVDQMMRVRRSVDGRSGSDPHQGYTREALRAKGVELHETPGNGPLEGTLQHYSARPADAPTGDLSVEQLQQVASGMKGTEPAVKNYSPKKAGS